LNEFVKLHNYLLSFSELINKKTMQIIKSIQNRIYEIRGERVMLDFDLAQLYEAETKVLNQAVKRNIKRFPPDFMFRLTLVEWQAIRSQSVTGSESTTSLRSQSVTASQSKRNTSVTPYAFTEQGVAMLSGILNSDKAISMPARMNPFGREHRHYAGLCRSEKGFAETN
jgi:ORF6N domain